MRHARAFLLPALLLIGNGCRHESPSGEPYVDRSDGALPILELPRFRPGSIAIDGRLDESEWQRAATTGPFVHPSTGKPALRSKVSAVGRFGWDDERLYLAVTVYDASPTTPFSRGEVDPHIWARASGVELMLQPGSHDDNRDYFELQVDVGGAVWDTRFDDYNRPISGGPTDQSRRFGHQEWASGVERGTSRAEGRYVVELSLPWRTLETGRAPTPPRAGDVWRANVYSFRDGQSDSLAWSPLLGQGNFHRTSRFGRLRFAE